MVERFTAVDKLLRVAVVVEVADVVVVVGMVGV